MDERAFTQRKRPQWERLADLLRKASSPGGLKSLTGPELLDLGKLYRQAASDLSYVKANSANEDLITYLNALAGRAHGYLYTDVRRSSTRSVLNFLLTGFPILFRAKWRFVAVAAAVFLVSAAFAAGVVMMNPKACTSFVPSVFG